ncbi:MAG: cation-transporting P-type ATPase [Bacteroidales bacterium]|nr:cation-transporting P-type ATPase [Bacteroidales bacterium]MCF8387791.1 cation-transporting P-type ATPase [Bacteroidales bacterium]MCF8398214.1 cation-transporting P-type ATPase [Bacteroidales bacterium]
MSKENFYTQVINEVAEHFKVEPEKGLSSEEVKSRLKKHGPNKLKETKEKSLWHLLFDQLKSAVIYLLMAAVIVSFLFGDIPEAIAIIVVIVFNTAIGFYMEYQARKSMKALQEMDKMTTKVLREGNEEEIDSEELVPGDIIILEAGNLIPADARIIEASELQINESALTGESVPITKLTETVDKDAQLGDRKNMAYKGTSITMGKGKAIVTASGMKTEIGGISEMVSAEDKESVPLNIKLNKLSKRLVWIVVGMAAVYGVLGYFTGKNLHIIAQTSIAWAIAAIPEGLAIVATIALAKGMMRLGKEHVIVKKLAAVETLGETTVILTDKTGTLTKNKLSLSQFFFNKERKKDEKLDEVPKEGSLFEKVLKVSLLCNNAELKEDGSGKGDMLEIAILQYAENQKEGITKEYREKFERIEEDPFDSDSMMMSTLHRQNGNYFSAVKGAANVILERCNKVLTDEGEEDLSKEQREKWKEESNAMSADGLRTIALAYKVTDKKENYDEDLVLLGLLGFIDPPAENVKDAIKTCLKAGIHVIMVTGDHPETARNIAKQVNITEKEEPSAYTGKDVEGFEDKGKDEKKKFAESRVFARVDPGQKLDILKLFQENGEIVGMTGDGVNDAPALKKADIGIAMGKRGTQVAKEVSDMVLKNDDFPSIITAIRQGRIIFNNIRKFIVYQLSYHLSEILVIAAVSFTIFTLPLRPLQLLFLNLLTDVFPALALGIGKGRGKVMEQPPKDPDEPILTKKSWTMISIYGAIIAVYTIGAYFFATYSMGVSKEIANNIAFFGLAFTQIFHVFDMRESDEKVFLNQVTRNKYVWMAVVFCAAALIAAYFIPGLNTLLSFQPMGLEPWLLVVAVVVASIGSIQVLKGFKIID